MKKKAVLIVLVLIIISLFLAIKFNGGVQTIEEAINISSLEPVNIIHEENNDKGTIVFSYISNGDSLYTAVVR